MAVSNRGRCAERPHAGGTLLDPRANHGAGPARDVWALGVKLLGDPLYWIENDVFDVDDIAVRFHHRLVSIHPFANGNGRVSRLAADLLAESLGRERFGWGADLAAEDPTEARRVYLEAMRRRTVEKSDPCSPSRAVEHA